MHLWTSARCTWPMRPLPYGPQRPLMKINKKVRITAAKTGFFTCSGFGWVGSHEMDPWTTLVGPKLFSVDSAISRNEGKSCEPEKSRRPTGWGFNTPPPKDRPRHHWYMEIRQRS